MSLFYVREKHYGFRIDSQQVPSPPTATEPHGDTEKQTLVRSALWHQVLSLREAEMFPDPI